MLIRTLIRSGFCTVMLAACQQIAADTGIAVTRDTVSHGQSIYAQECAQCHGPAGEGGGPATLGIGVVPPDLVRLSARNGGTFPRDFVRQYVLGLTEENDSAGPMPDFARVGLRHVYPKGGADGEVLETDFESLLDYLEAIQK